MRPGASVELPEEERPVSFGLAEVIIAVTVIASTLGLVRALSLLGLLVVFVMAVVFTLWMHSLRRAPESRRPDWLHEAKRRWLSDAIWGVLMPVLCIWLDPFVFAERDIEFLDPEADNLVRTPTPRGLAAYPIIGYQLLVMMVWLFLGHRLRPLGSFFAGSLLVGILVSGIIGICLVPFALLGAIMLGIGFIGLTPLLTARAFIRRSEEAWQYAHPRASLSYLGGFLGIVFAIAIPAGVYLGLINLLAR